VRADARRNRDRIVEVARELARAKGYDALTMDEVAKKAGIGAGTLYRHFPTKDALHDAVIEAWADKVNAAVDAAMEAPGTPRERLALWLREYTAMLTAHQGAAARITASLGVAGSPYEAKCQTYMQANQRVIDALGSDLRPDAEALQMCRLVGGVAAVADNSGLPAEAVTAMLDVLADGLLAPRH